MAEMNKISVNWINFSPNLRCCIWVHVSACTWVHCESVCVCVRVRVCACSLKWHVLSRASTSNTLCLLWSLKTLQTKFWPSCRTRPWGWWAPKSGAVLVSARCWMELKVHTDGINCSQVPWPTMLCWCWTRALGRTLATRWAFSMWTWMWQRRDAPIWMAFTWVSCNTLLFCPESVAQSLNSGPISA